MSETIFIAPVEGVANCDCRNCDWEGSSEELAEFDATILLPGTIVPAGRCPICGYLSDVKQEAEEEAA
jgi:hypothetical protein